MEIRDLVDPEILGGQPVFKGTRVPIETLFDHLEAGVSLDAFLDDFPTVSKQQATAVLEVATKLLTSKNIVKLYETAAWREFTKRLKADFPDHEVYIVRDMNWNGIKNGQLLQLMAQNSFHALLTSDKNLQYQQNFLKYTLTVFVLSAPNNTCTELTKLSSRVNTHLDEGNLPVGPIIIAASEAGG